MDLKDLWSIAMSKKENYNYKYFKDPKNVEKVAIKNNCEIREGKGSHKVIKEPNGKIMVYYSGKEISDGVAHAIFKFFKALGFLYLIAVIYVQIIDPIINMIK